MQRYYPEWKQHQISRTPSSFPRAPAGEATMGKEVRIFNFTNPEELPVLAGPKR